MEAEKMGSWEDGKKWKMGKARDWEIGKVGAKRWKLRCCEDEKVGAKRLKMGCCEDEKMGGAGA